MPYFMMQCFHSFIHSSCEKHVCCWAVVKVLK